MFYNNKAKAPKGDIGEGKPTHIDRVTRSSTKEVGNVNKNKTQSPGGSSKKY